MSQTPESVRATRIDGSSVRGRKKALADFSRYHTLAVEIAVAVIAPILAGRWLDSRTGKDPWFMIIGMILGAAAAARSVHRTIMESREDIRGDEKTASREPAAGGPAA